MNRNEYYSKKKDGSPAKSLIGSKAYTGPEILPQMPKFIADKMKYSDLLEIQNLSNMEILKRNFEMQN